MYIEGKYWRNYIGDTDDSLTLVEHLAGKRKEEIPVGEIFSDFGMDKLQGNYKNPDVPLVFVSPEGWETPVYYAIDLITDLAALLLECKMNGTVDLRELFEGAEVSVPNVRITAAPEEHELMNRALADFASAPLDYDLSEMCSQEEMLEMASLCGELREELYGLRAGQLARKEQLHIFFIRGFHGKVRSPLVWFALHRGPVQTSARITP